METIVLLMQAAGGDLPVHYSLGTAIMALIAHTVYREIRDRKTGNGNGNGRSRLEEIEYWERMEARVTRPIVEALRELKR